MTSNTDRAVTALKRTLQQHLNNIDVFNLLMSDPAFAAHHDRLVSDTAHEQAEADSIKAVLAHLGVN